MLRLSAFAPLPPSRVVPRRFTKLTIGVLGLLALLPYHAAADEVFDWNVAGFDAAVAGGQNNVVVSRTMAMLHLAIHDALNAIDRRYEPYLYRGNTEPSATPTAAIATAARDVLVWTIPAWGKPEQREGVEHRRGRLHCRPGKAARWGVQEAGDCGRTGFGRGHTRGSQG